MHNLPSLNVCSRFSATLRGFDECKPSAKINLRLT
ncbi:hypothetical protein VCHC50A2_3215A, partial [Vibrio cholerae HC-50A2]